MNSEKARAEFCKVFADFYGLNAAGLGPVWKAHYFKLLFALQKGAQDPYTPLLLDLHEIKLLNGHQALEFSFVSKLVTTHDESQPIYDKHVLAFFGVKAPGPGSQQERIAEFRHILATVRGHYASWVVDPRFAPLRKTLVDTEPELANSHPHRLCDMLVWTVGGKRIGVPQ